MRKITIEQRWFLVKLGDKINCGYGFEDVTQILPNRQGPDTVTFVLASGLRLTQNQGQTVEVDTGGWSTGCHVLPLDVPAAFRL